MKCPVWSDCALLPLLLRLFLCCARTSSRSWTSTPTCSTCTQPSSPTATALEENANSRRRSGRPPKRQTSSCLKVWQWFKDKSDSVSVHVVFVHVQCVQKESSFLCVFGNVACIWQSQQLWPPAKQVRTKSKARARRRTPSQPPPHRCDEENLSEYEGFMDESLSPITAFASLRPPQVPPLTDDPAKRAASKPKKKKSGLFRWERFLKILASLFYSSF